MVQEKLLQIYQLMFEHFGDRHWWPAQTKEEVVIGAILVQNVSWSNTEKAIEKLRQQDLLSFAALHRAPLDEIEPCVVSTRFYKTKAKKLKAFSDFLDANYKGDLEAFLRQPVPQLREQLLNIYGIGPETADDIVLYAGGQLSFVIDAYTQRILARLGITQEQAGYEELRTWFMENLPADVALFNQYHALLDAVGHHYCSPKNPSCTPCPLAPLCQYAQQNHSFTQS
ncbi:endonuclease [Alicyclobacillus tolerans]|uniref:endonuclease III domain-containing protein n=1 Tax=Alicyclobacillus tolerans TaxID=90970 RepID=UPI001F24011E|nr:endonuclease [Alicyclobacillus tolerans]MCF8563645.1 endonuclease [Alicyclobacillus tolerans]